jgi:hypothetical protein
MWSAGAHLDGIATEREHRRAGHQHLFLSELRAKASLLEAVTPRIVLARIPSGSPSRVCGFALGPSLR